MKARILCSASPRSTSSDRLHQRRHWQKMPRLWSGAFLLGRGRTRPGSARLDEPRRFSFGSGRFGESAGTIRRRGRKDPALWPKAKVTRQGGGTARSVCHLREALPDQAGSRGAQPSLRTTFRRPRQHRGHQRGPFPKPDRVCPPGQPKGSAGQRPVNQPLTIPGAKRLRYARTP